MTSDRHSLFIPTLEFLFRAQNSIHDPFFADRLSEGIHTLLAGYIEYRSLARPQSVLAREHLRNCKEVSGLLEQISYVGCADAVLVRMGQERLLGYVRQIIVDIKNIPAEPPATRSAAPAQSLPPRVQTPAKAARPRSLDRNKTHEKILEFVRRVPDCRPKDIIGEFSALSQRTVKRSLKELSEMGLIVKKTTEDKAVYYSASSA